MVGEKRACVYEYVARNDFGKLTIIESRWRVFLYLKVFHSKMGKFIISEIYMYIHLYTYIYICFSMKRKHLKPIPYLNEQGLALFTSVTEV